MLLNHVVYLEVDIDLGIAITDPYDLELVAITVLRTVILAPTFFSGFLLLNIFY